MSSRIERCFNDNIYLIESFPYLETENERTYLIMGSTGNVYTVIISNKSSCTCPDYRKRKKRCKHIYFVLIRIMKVENPEKKIFSNEELKEMFNNIPLITNNLIIDKNKREKFYEITNKINLNKSKKKIEQKINDNDICPICLDSLNNGKELDYCKYSCGLSLHKKCYQMWEKRNKGICVFCRANWYNEDKGKKNKKILYVNLYNDNVNFNMIKNSFVNNLKLKDLYCEEDIKIRERSRDKDD